MAGGHAVTIKPSGDQGRVQHRSHQAQNSLRSGLAANLRDCDCQRADFRLGDEYLAAYVWIARDKDVLPTPELEFEN